MENEREVLLEVNHLNVTYGSGKKAYEAVQDANFKIYKGETFGLVGESGSGKTTIGRAILRIQECLLGMSMTLIISSTISRRRLGLLISTKTYSHTVYALTVHLKFLIGMNERRNCTYHIGMKHLTQSKKC